MKGFKKTVMILIVCLISISSICMVANSQGFLFGLLIGSTLSDDESEKSISSNQIYLNKEKLEKVNIENVRFIIISVSMFEEGKTLLELFEEENAIKKQIEEGCWYEWVSIWREGNTFIFAYILK